MLEEAITIGVLIGFINTLSKIFIPIREFAQQLAVIQRALSALEHIHKLFSEKPEENEAEIPEKMEEQLSEFESLVFDRVSFRYGPDDPPALKNISFQLNRGEKIALVGKNVINSVYDLFSGINIKINGYISAKGDIKVYHFRQIQFIFNEIMLLKTYNFFDLIV